VLILASEDPGMIIDGRPPSDSAYASYYTSIPAEYQGGVGKEGVDAIKDFVEQGGILVTLNQACKFAFREFAVPARSVLEGIDRTKFFCPTSLLKIFVDSKTPVGFGMPDESPAMFANSVVMDTSIPASVEWDRRVVASFPEQNILMSGWLLGEDQITRKAAVVDTKFKKGRIILIGIRCQNRAQTHGTYKFLLNSLLYPESN
jgi:hypothetical protein